MCIIVLYKIFNIGFNLRNSQAMPLPHTPHHHPPSPRAPGLPAPLLLLMTEDFCCSSVNIQTLCCPVMIMVAYFDLAYLQCLLWYVSSEQNMHVTCFPIYYVQNGNKTQTRLCIFLDLNVCKVLILLVLHQTIKFYYHSGIAFPKWNVAWYPFFQLLTVIVL